MELVEHPQTRQQRYSAALAIASVISSLTSPSKAAGTGNPQAAASRAGDAAFGGFGAGCRSRHRVGHRRPDRRRYRRRRRRGRRRLYQRGLERRVSNFSPEFTLVRVGSSRLHRRLRHLVPRRSRAAGSAAALLVALPIPTSLAPEHPQPHQPGQDDNGDDGKKGAEHAQGVGVRETPQPQWWEASVCHQQYTELLLAANLRCKNIVSVL